MTRPLLFPQFIPERPPPLLERSIAYAYVPPEVEVGAEVEVNIFGEWAAGEVAREPLFDPKGARVRA